MGDGYVSYTTVAEWVHRFKRGRTFLDDDPRIGRPVTEATDQNIEVIRTLIDENPHISIRYMVFETGLSYCNINRIIHDELKLKRLCARWIPHQFTKKCKQQRMEICQENLAKLESGQWRLCDIITGDETWICHRSIRSKQNNMAWCSEGASSATVIKRNQSDQKNMFVVIFQTAGSTFIHMIESRNSITGAYYKNNCLKPLFDNIRRQRSKSGLHAIKMHHDNARAHQTKDIQIFLQEQGVMVMAHPPYSPDLAPSDFRLFKKAIRQLFGFEKFTASCNQGNSCHTTR